MEREQIEAVLLENLTREQRQAVTSRSQKLMVIAGAGSGKTEIMARRVAWWVAVNNIPKEKIVAFTFTESAAEELKFRIRNYISRVSEEDDATLGGMYIGTIHGFCLKVLRDFAPDDYYNYDILDEASRMALVEKGYFSPLGLNAFKERSGIRTKTQAIAKFLKGYDLLNEYNLLDVTLADDMPADVREEREWCNDAVLNTDVGNNEENIAFSVSAARFYAYMRARRLLDFSTSQSESIKVLNSIDVDIDQFRSSFTHLVVDEVQDINPVQDSLIRLITGDTGELTVVGDHRQAIYSFRGGRVELMSNLAKEINESENGEIVELPDNFRSTSKIIQFANSWSQSITQLGELENPAMSHGNLNRHDVHDSHIQLNYSNDRIEEGNWIADSIKKLVNPTTNEGAYHDTRSGVRGISYSDIAVMVRSATDMRTYQEILQSNGIPVVVKSGPGLFAQAEILLALSALANCTDMVEFFGVATNNTSLPGKIRTTLGCSANVLEVMKTAIEHLRASGIPLQDNLFERLVTLTTAIRNRIEHGHTDLDLSNLSALDSLNWLTTEGGPTRLFPQRIYRWILTEIGLEHIDAEAEEHQTTLFHLGQLSTLIKSMELPGWTPANGFKWLIIALCQWGATSARTEDSDLLISPDAVSIITAHSSKGLQYPAVFIADVVPHRFPSRNARQRVPLPFSGEILDAINPAHLADNENYDDERRLMYVALTRAERYLFITTSRKSQFFRELEFIAEENEIICSQGDSNEILNCEYHPISFNEDIKLKTNFSDLRYYLECPHDFYLRKVLGFTPTIDQAFGYGKGVHNILRDIHSNPAYWNQLTQNPAMLRRVVLEKVNSGLFYLRYTTGEPLDNMRNVAYEGIKQYVEQYSGELGNLEFEPEKEFETLVDDENILISGAIDVVRLDNPPRVTIIDFKSGSVSPDGEGGLSRFMMELQIAIYGLAAKSELLYEPDKGLVRYIGERDLENSEMEVSLAEADIENARNIVIDAARDIKNRIFMRGPTDIVDNRCSSCDFHDLCGHKNL